MAEIIANRYEIIKSLGRGGMANVYLAFDRILKRDVAIKILKADMSSDPVSLQRFSREANASTKLSHPNIVDIYDVGEDNGKHYIVMEYVKGYTLKQLLQRRGAIPPREAVWMTRQLAAALMEAHKNGLIHRDIKSQNVLIKDDGTVKLADFGIAILSNSMQLTSKDSVLGSVHYLAPELAKGEAASMKSDIYSLGIVLYELLTGDVPFKGDTPVQIALKHIKNEIPDVRKFNSAIPQSVVNVLTRATAKNPRDRYDNIALMLKDLNTCLDDSRTNEKPISTKSSSSIKKDYNISETADHSLKKAKTNKVQKGFSTLLIISISLVSIIVLLMILFFTGFFFKKQTNLTEVPDIVGMSLLQATDKIDASGLKVDYPVKRQLTDDTEKDIVISVTPFEGSSVEKGSKITLIVSDGIFSVMPDYVGKDIDEVAAFLGNSIHIQRVDVIDSEKEPGTIIKQSGINAGDKFDAYDNNLTIIFEVAIPEMDNIPTQLLGLDIDDAVEILDEEGFNSQLIKIDISELNDTEKVMYEPGTVCRMDPSEGTLFYKNEESIIKLYYYEKAKNIETLPETQNNENSEVD